jgi:voltage-dependent calcium channel T type alpha-1I
VTFDSEDKYYQNCVTRICFHVVNSPIFNGFIILIILLNTIVLAMDQYPEIEGTIADIFHIANVIFTIIFTIEVVLKVIGLKVKGYVADKFNIFDAIIVLVSIVEMFIVSDEGGEGGAFSALRAFRLFRIFKIFRSGDLRTLLDSITFTVLTIKDYTILLCLFIYVFTLFGMNFFAGKAWFDDQNNVDTVNGKPPRANFDTFSWSALTVFEIMIGENWNGVMYDHMRSAGPLSSVFFIFLVIFGNIIMLNLFLTILL